MKKIDKVECKIKTMGMVLLLSLQLNATVFADHLTREVMQLNPGDVTLKDVIYAGTGCPIGSLNTRLAGDLNSISLEFDSLAALAGPGVPFSLSRKNCQIMLDLQVPAGISYSVVDVDLAGYARLDEGAAGLQKTSYYFRGQREAGAFITEFEGGIDSDYRVQNSIPLSDRIWSPCGESRALNINTQVRVRTHGEQSAVLTVDTLNARVNHVYGLEFRRCEEIGE